MDHSTGSRLEWDDARSGPLLEYNFREVTEEMRQGGPGELPGMSTFALWGMYQWLDRAPLGRNEHGSNAGWLRRHDSYAAATA
jgi:predicted dithiol-disulfide oxidoreductase (DUF899 family)